MKQLVAGPVFFAALLTMTACRRQGPAYLQACTFCANADSAGQDHPDSLMGYVWNRKVCFEDDSFGRRMNFTYCTFLDTAVFTDASFSQSVDFSHDTFRQPAYFDDVSFAANTHFVAALFSHYAKFANLQSTGNVGMQFDDAALPDTLDFSQNPALKCKIDLTTANFDRPDRNDPSFEEYIRPHYLFLYNTDISRFKLDYFHFRLLLPDSTITPTLGIRHQRISKDEKEAMYLSLLNNFKQNGQKESYKRLDIEYQQFRWRNSWRRWFVWVPCIWWNFGYNKEYVFIWIAGSLLLFSLINAGCLRLLNTQVYEAIDPEKLKDLTGFRKRWWYSVQYTANIFFRLTLDQSAMRFERLGMTIYFFCIYILGVLCLGYLANFILQK